MRAVVGSSRRRGLSASASLVAITLAASASATSSKDQCIDAHTLGQKLRLDGKLDDAREQFSMCSDAVCPALVRDDCTRRLAEVERAQPTVVFDVVDAAGAPLAGVHVTLDGRPVADLEGSALRVDPGERVFTFNASGAPPVTRRLVIKEGEKERRERVAVAMATPLAPTGASPSTIVVEGPAPTASGAPIPPASAVRRGVGLTLGGVGIAGLGVGGVFGGLTLAAAHQQKIDCASATACVSRSAALSDHSSAQTDGMVSNVVFIGSGALLALGAVLFFTAPGSSSPTERSLALAARWRLVPAIGSRGAGVIVRGEL